MVFATVETPLRAISCFIIVIVIIIVTIVTRLFDQNVDTTIIKNQTGHRSNVVDGYKRISDAQQQAVSMMLRSGIKREKTETFVRNELSANTDDVDEPSANTDHIATILTPL